MSQKSAIQTILKKADSKLKTAQIDFENGQFDDAVSRSYYAVFHAVTAVLLSKEMVFSSHSQTIGAFNKEFVKTGLLPSEFSRIIQDLFGDRQIGDYDAEVWIDRETAEKSIQDADKILTAIKSYLEKEGMI